MSSDTHAVRNPVEDAVDPASLVPDAVWEDEWKEKLLEAATAKVRRRADPEKYPIFYFYVNKEWPAAKVADFRQMNRSAPLRSAVYQGLYHGPEGVRVALVAHFQASSAA